MFSTAYCKSIDSRVMIIVIVICILYGMGGVSGSGNLTEKRSQMRVLRHEPDEPDRDAARNI